MLLFFITSCKSLIPILLKQKQVDRISKTDKSVKNLYLFDFDGTLYTSTPKLKYKANKAQEKCLKKHLDKENYKKEITYKEFVKKYTFPFYGLIRLGHDPHTVLNETVNKVFKNFKLEISDKIVEKIRNLPGDKMILTNNLAEKVKDIINDSKLKDIFTFVIGPDFYSKDFISKPSKNVFHILNNKFKNDLQYENIYFFDDERKNVEEGKLVKWISIECTFKEMFEKLSKLNKN
ncbi:pyrimidine 5 -nucleotidase [Tubulinosema ratisbonensis]|uniref:Pyrimidine 5-nucleotidase n=1 Tax=Tubulinosema ratisbonensis TaxID=291195 RepID=A0A437AK10_9MICR|nr:pyrimidine 5 -nucleotidase [Tubulinosema ratisbonensis]